MIRYTLLGGARNFDVGFNTVTEIVRNEVRFRAKIRAAPPIPTPYVRIVVGRHTFVAGLKTPSLSLGRRVMSDFRAIAIEHAKDCTILASSIPTKCC